MSQNYYINKLNLSKPDSNFTTATNYTLSNVNNCTTYGNTDLLWKEYKTTWYPLDTTPIEYHNHYHYDTIWKEYKVKQVVEEVVKTLGKEAIKMPSFPHSDVWLDANYVLHIQLAMAGYPKDNITVDISKSNELYVKASIPNEDSKRAYLYNGIKKKDIDFTLKLDSIYDSEKASVKFDNGLLTVSIPRKEEFETKRLTLE